MFFSLIRRMNGHNNNPTTTQYTSAYKKLLFNNKMNINISSSANCSPLDQTLLISEEYSTQEEHSNNNDENLNITSDTASNSKKISIETPCKSKLSSIQVDDFLNNNNYHSFEHNYSKSSWYSSEYAEEIIKYTAGSIVRILKRKIHCQKCCDILDGTNSNFQSKLTILKNRGGLNFASDDVNFICKCTEKIIRQQNNLFAENIYIKLITETLQVLPSSILDDNNHYLEQEILMDHRNQLILLIIQKYIDIRLKHESKILNDQNQRIRMQNNKLTIFSGQ